MHELLGRPNRISNATYQPQRGCRCLKLVYYSQLCAPDRFIASSVQISGSAPALSTSSRNSRIHALELQHQCSSMTFYVYTAVLLLALGACVSASSPHRVLSQLRAGGTPPKAANSAHSLLTAARRQSEQSGTLRASLQTPQLPGGVSASAAGQETAVRAREIACKSMQCAGADWPGRLQWRK